MRGTPQVLDEMYDKMTLAVVERALTMRVREYPGGVFYVTGGNEPHWVHLYDAAQLPCDCEDHFHRYRVCKHLAAVLIYIGDYRVWRRLQELAEAA